MIVRIITGPTASGKSAIAMRLAEHVPIAIVSADSRQVYRDFDIGTAKPTAVERARVPHEGIDLIGPEERYSAARWSNDARGWIDTWRTRGREPVIVGGTGFYLRALAEPLAPVPDLDPERRAALDRVLGPMPTAELRRWCESLDPLRAHLGRTQLLRAIETAVLTGSRISGAFDRAASPGLVTRYLVVDPGPLLRDRIVHRTDAMLSAGWVDEVRRLAATVARDAPAWNATGYAAVRDHVEAGRSLGDAREHIIIATRQYAKRQRTWMRHQLDGDVTRIDPTAHDAWDRVLEWWNANGDESA